MKTYISMLLIAGAIMGVSLPAQAQQQESVSAPQMIAQATDASAIAQQFVEMLAAGDYSGALQMYDSVIRAGLNPNGLQTDWQSLENESGEFQTVVSSTTVSTEGSPIVVVTCAFAGGNRELFISLTPANQIASFSAVEAQ